MIPEQLRLLHIIKNNYCWLACDPGSVIPIDLNVDILDRSIIQNQHSDKIFHIKRSCPFLKKNCFSHFGKVSSSIINKAVILYIQLYGEDSLFENIL